MTLPLMQALWDVPDTVQTAITSRTGGVSVDPWDTLNLGFHVGDDPESVSANREVLKSALPGQPDIQWLQQMHGTEVSEVSRLIEEPPKADALYTTVTGLALTVMVADCMPVFLASRDGNEIAVAHAGWRGLVNGVLENTISHFDSAPENIQAFLGPAIGPCHFEVGDEVREQFISASNPANLRKTEASFTSGSSADKWMADLYQLATIRLNNLGIEGIKGEPRCTVCHEKHFYSYRRDGVTGRFAAMIWLNPA